MKSRKKLSLLSRVRSVAISKNYILLFGATLFVGITLAILNVVASTEPQEIHGIVVTKGTLQGYERSGDRLVIEIETGVKVTVSVPHQVGVVSGDRVKLLTYERYLLAPKYSYLGKLPD